MAKLVLLFYLTCLETLMSDRLNHPVLAALVATAVALTLAGCGKAKEKASEKVAEKILESSMNKDGSTSKVDLSGGGTKVSTTDANGKTSVMEMGNAKVTEADLGLPMYPGSTALEGKSTRIVTPEGSMVSVELQSTEPQEKVAAFYRERIKAMGAGGQVMDMSEGDKVTLVRSDENTKNSVQVHLRKTETRTEITLVASKQLKPS
jgi:outer membrane lipopolysaccharide assembly protein LptE/RlpB